MTTDNWKAHAEKVEKQGRLNQARITLMTEIIDELKEERGSLLQRIDLLTIAGEEATKQRNEAIDEVAGHKQSFAETLSRNLKLAQYCGEAEREAARLVELLDSREDFWERTIAAMKQEIEKRNE